MSQKRIYWLHALTPTHVGTGRGVGYIDLPIHREKVTNWPVIPGSAFKGVWSDACRQLPTAKAELLDAAFGKASGESGTSTENQAQAGALVPTDARIVSLPIRSFYGTFAWCTCPLALQMLHRDLSLLGISGLPQVPKAIPAARVHVAENSTLAFESRVLFEDLDFASITCPTATAWAKYIAESVFPGDEDSHWRDAYCRRFAVLSDDVFDFLSTTGTEVVARVRISDSTKTVERGALWNEELLPAETIMAGSVLCERVYQANGNGITTETLIKEFATGKRLLQIGGKASVGRGRVQVRFSPVGGT